MIRHLKNEADGNWQENYEPEIREQKKNIRPAEHKPRGSNMQFLNEVENLRKKWMRGKDSRG